MGMGLPLRLETLDDLPDGFKDAYVAAKDGNGFELDYAAIKDHPGVAKVRQTADELDRKRKDGEKTLKELTDKFGDLDPEAARAALKAIEDQGDKDLLDEGKVDELVQKRVEKMKAEFENQIAAKDELIATITGNLETRDSELSDIKIYDTIKDAALSKGARKDALQDISNRARGVWKLGEDGKPVAMDGDTQIMGAQATPLTIDEWVGGLAKDADYLFEPNSGGGAGGGDSGSGSGDGVQSIGADQAGDFIGDIAEGKKTVAH